jgi:predicted nucleic acid-binding protein
VLRVLLRGIRTTLRRASPPAPGDAQLGAVSFLHRFGSALNPHFHFHVVVLDGVFSEDDDGSVTFHEATHHSTDDVLRLERTLQRRVLRLFRCRGLLDEHTVDGMLVAMLEAKGRISLSRPVNDWVHAALHAPVVRLLPLSPEIATESTRLPGGPPGDPADRILMASARHLGGELATCDREILDYSAGGQLKVLNCIP